MKLSLVARGLDESVADSLKAGSSSVLAFPLLDVLRHIRLRLLVSASLLLSSAHVAILACSQNLDVIHERAPDMSSNIAQAIEADGFATESAFRPPPILIIGKKRSSAISALKIRL